MPMPWTYRHASSEWQAFLEDAKDRMGLSSDNMAYTAIDGVFRVFRRRLSVQEGLIFASPLPSVPRAIFVKDWDVSQPPLPFAPRDDLIAEVKALRKAHNLTPDTAIEATAFALRRSTWAQDFERVMARLPQEARDFWHIEVDDPSELEQRIR